MSVGSTFPIALLIISFHRVMQGVRGRNADGSDMQTLLHTFGYEGLAIEVFISRLKATGVETVVDVRANPLSRKRGFSKRSLAAALKSEGIAYRHMPAMGCPKSVRDQYKLDQDWALYTKGFLAYLDAQPAALADLAATAAASSCCLVCFEADFNYCHRTFVARAAAPMFAAGVVHLTATATIVDQDVKSAA